MLLLLAELTAKPSSTDEVEGVLRSLVDVTREEPGNIVYAIHQRRNDVGRFLLYELYVDQAACNTHLARESVKAALAQLAPLLVAPAEVTFCTTIATSGIELRAASLR